MKTFQQFQEDISKLPGLGGGGGGTNSITDKSPAKSIKKRVIDAGKMATVPARFLLNIKSKPDPTEKFADSRMTPKEKVSSAIRDYKKQKKVNESVASLAVKGGSKLIPALMTGIGAAGTIMQIKKRVPKNKSKTADMARKQGLDLTNPRDRRKANSLVRQNQMKNKKNNPDGVNLKTSQVIKPKKNEVERTEKLIDKYKATNKVIKPKEGEIAKQRELLKNVERKITKPKKGEKKDASKTVKDFLKARKKEGETMYRLKQDAELADKGPGDLLPAAKKSYLEKLRRNLRKPENQFHTEDAIPTNNVSGGQIAGTVEAGDNPPVKKKKKTYAYGGRGSRKMWMNNK